MQDKKPNKIAVMQPYFFPYIGYFQLINAVDKFVIYDDVNYIKRGYISRNTICEPNKNSQFIRLVISKISQNKLIKEHYLVDESAWKTTLLRQIMLSYKKAPYYKQVFSLVEKIVNCEELNLAKFLCYSLQEVCNYLKIDTQLIETSVRYNNKGLDKAGRLIDICKQENCGHYINSIGGQVLYDKEFFKKKNIQLDFIKTESENIVYKQFTDEFIPNLSIIDVMMFNSVEEIKPMLDKYTLV